MKSGERIEVFRRAVYLSRERFAYIASICPTTLYLLERDRTLPRARTLQKIVDAFHFEPSIFSDLGLGKNPKKIEIDYDFLKERYSLDGQTAQQIAGKLGCSKSVVLARLKEYGIERRPRFRQNGAVFSLDPYPCLKKEFALQGQAVLQYPRVKELLKPKIYFALACRFVGNTLEETAVLSSTEFGEPRVTREMVRQRQNTGLGRLERYLINGNNI